MWIYRPIHSRQCEADLSPRCHPVKTEVQTSFDPDSTAAGVHAYTGTTTNYFSVNGGTTNLDNFNTSPNGGSRDWASSAEPYGYLVGETIRAGPAAPKASCRRPARLRRRSAPSTIPHTSIRQVKTC